MFATMQGFIIFKTHFGARLVDPLQLVVEDVPLGVDDLLVLLDVVDADLSVVLLGLQLLLMGYDKKLGTAVVGQRLSPSGGAHACRVQSITPEIVGSIPTSYWVIFSSLFIPQKRVFNQVPQGGAALLICLNKKWMLSCAAWGETSIICTD